MTANATVKIKICGLKTEADAIMMNELKPDCIGMVFAPQSSRYLTEEGAARVVAALNGSIKRVGVFVNEDTKKIVRLCERGIIDVIQLHGREDGAEIHALKRLFNLPIIKAVKRSRRGVIVGQSGEELDEREAKNLLDSFGDADAFLVDTYLMGADGGSGEFAAFGVLASDKPIILAGGLDSENVSLALKCLPYAVDVSSGVETDGKKDYKKVEKFINTVRSYTI